MTLQSRPHRLAARDFRDRLSLGVATLALLLGAIGGTPPRADDAGAPEAAPVVAEPTSALALIGPERFRYEGYPSQLVVEDFNGDGRRDLVTYDSGRSLLTILYSQQDASPAVEEFRLDDDGEWVFRPTQIVMSIAVTSMQAGDLDGDGRADLVVASSQEQALLFYQEEQGLSETPVKLDQKTQRLVVHDLNGDGRDDLLLVTKDGFEVLLQDEEGKLQAGGPFSSSASPARDPLLSDFDGDGIVDIAFTESGKPQNLIVRMGEGDGHFGAETPFEIDDNYDLRATKSGFLAYIEPTTRAIKVASLRRDTRDQLVTRADLAPAILLPLPSEIASGKPDAVTVRMRNGGISAIVSLSEGAELFLLREQPTGRLAFEAMPSLAGITSLAYSPRVISSAGGGDLLLLSEKERLAARLPLESTDALENFPSPIEHPDTPLAIATGRDVGRRALYTLYRPDDDDDADLAIGRVFLDDAPTTSALAGEAPPIVLGESVDMEPESLVAADINNDGHDDFVVFFEFEPPMMYLSKAASADAPAIGVSYLPLPNDEGLKRGLLKDVAARDFLVADVDGDGESEIVIARGNFVRIYRMNPDNDLVIESQLTPPGRSSGLVAPLAADLDRDGYVDILCIDEKEKHLLVFPGRAEDGFDSAKIADIPEMRPVKLLADDWSGDGHCDVVILGAKKLAMLRGGDDSYRIETLHTRLTDIPDGLYARLFVAPIVDPARGTTPLDSLVAIEARENMLELLDIEKGDADTADSLESLFRFKVFNTPRPLDAQQLRRMSAEPHDLVVADIDDDGLQDLVVLAHNNVIVYRQRRPAVVAESSVAMSAASSPLAKDADADPPASASPAPEKSE